MSPAALSGELTFATVDACLARADALIADGTLDLAAVTNIDSAGLALLLELTRRARAAGRKLAIGGANEQVQRLIRFFGVDEVLSLAV